MRTLSVLLVTALVMSTAHASDAPFTGVLTRTESAVVAAGQPVGERTVVEPAGFWWEDTTFVLRTESAEIYCLDGEPLYKPTGARAGAWLNGTCEAYEDEAGIQVVVDGYATGADLVVAGNPAATQLFRVQASGTFTGL